MERMGPTIKLEDGIEYVWLASDTMNFTRFLDRVEIEGPMEATNVCPHCHRADFRKAKAHSWEEAIERGWLAPMGSV